MNFIMMLIAPLVSLTKRQILNKLDVSPVCPPGFLFQLHQQRERVSSWLVWCSITKYPVISVGIVFVRQSHFVAQVCNRLSRNSVVLPSPPVSGIKGMYHHAGHISVSNICGH